MMSRYRIAFLIWLAVMVPLTGYLWVEARSHIEPWVTVDSTGSAPTN